MLHPYRRRGARAGTGPADWLRARAAAATRCGAAALARGLAAVLPSPAALRAQEPDGEWRMAARDHTKLRSNAALRAVAAGVAFAPASLLAHVGSSGVEGPRNWSELARAWEWEPLLVLALLLSAWIYARGVRRLWAEAGRGRGLRCWEVLSFWTGWMTVVVALASPLHPWGRVLFSAHMTQHELLMVAAAPLLVLGRPMVALLFALPKPDARQLSHVARVPWVKTSWHALTNPLVAWAVHAVALWTWHVPKFFQATLTSNFVHDLQHLSFFGSALLFWWALIHGGPGRRGFGVAVLYLFTTMLHTGLLGALITLAGTQIYPAYAAGGDRWSLTPLEDQQLGGLIMWVPAGLVYIVSALALIAGWMRSTEAEEVPLPGNALQAGQSPEAF